MPESKNLPKATMRYWNRRLETMRPDERDALILRKLKRLLRHSNENSIYYHDLFSKIGIDISSIRSLEDFSRKVPLTTKAVVRSAQAGRPPFGEISAREGRYSLVMASSGTTGRPTYVPFTDGELDSFSEAHARIMWSFGIRARMQIMIAAMFSLYGGSWGAFLGSRRLGLGVIPVGAGTTGGTLTAVKVAQDLKPEVLYGTPSYILHFLDVARSQGIDPRRDYAFKIVFGSGEPGFSLPSIKNKVRSSLGEDVKVLDTGSMLEAMPWMTNAECEYENGMHLWQDIVYTEVADPDDGRTLGYGSEGSLVYTSLDRRFYPLIRYHSGDLTTWVNEPCPCGRTYPRLPRGIYGRIDDMLVVKGVKTMPSFIQEALEKSRWYNGEFRIVISSREGADTLRIMVEVTPEALKKIEGDRACESAIASEVASLILDRIGIKPLVEIVAPGGLERTVHKARRIVDERDVHKELQKLRLSRD